MAKKKTPTRRRRATAKGTGKVLFKVGKRSIRTTPALIGFASQAAEESIKKMIPTSWANSKWGAKVIGVPSAVGLAAGGYLLGSDDVFSAGVGQIAAAALGFTI